MAAVNIYLRQGQTPTTTIRLYDATSFDAPLGGGAIPLRTMTGVGV